MDTNVENVEKIEQNEPQEEAKAISNEEAKNSELGLANLSSVKIESDHEEEKCVVECQPQQDEKKQTMLRLSVISMKLPEPTIGFSTTQIDTAYRQKPVKFDWFYIMPIFYFCIPALTFISGAITTAYLIPISDETFSTVGSGFQFTRMLAIVLDTAALVLVVYVLVSNLTRFLGASGIDVVKNLTEIIITATIFLLVPFNLVMVVAEISMPESYFNDKVNEYAFLSSGVFGLLSVVPLMGLMFFTKIYEAFCIKFQPSVETRSEITEI